MQQTNRSVGEAINDFQRQVLEHETNEDYVLAFEIQSKIVNLLENEPSSVSGDLGDAFFHLGRLAFQTGQLELAVGYLCKALGFRRIFFGKGHEKVTEVMDLIKEIRSKTPKKTSTKVDKRTAEYRRSVVSQDHCV